jgi:mono/diheme cytochrome c family protein
MKNNRPKIFLSVIVGTLVLILFIMWAGNDFQALRSAEPPFQLKYDMMYQEKVMAQEPSLFFADRKSMRDYIPGTLPRDGYIYPYKSYEEAEAALSNPFAGDMSVLARGKNRFDAFCAPCHSANGQDTTEVVRKGMQMPKNLVADQAKGYSDAHLFHIISYGQNVMPSYADKLTPEDRWKIVNYVRELQKQPLLYAEAPKTDSTATNTTNDTAAPAAQTGN